MLGLRHGGGMWLRQLLQALHNLHREPPWSTATSTWFTSPPTLSSMHTKHAEIDLHFIRERVTIGDIRVLHVPTTS
jgi:hypothetical protein